MRKRIHWSQKLMLAIGTALVAVHAVKANSDAFRQSGRVHVSAAAPQIIDGDQITLDGLQVKLIGIDAPDEDPMRQRAADHLKRLSAQYGGIRCSAELLLREAGEQRPPLTCVFIANNADVAATMVSHGFAVDQPTHSHGRYAQLMADAATHRRGLWNDEYRAISMLARTRNGVPAQ